MFEIYERKIQNPTIQKNSSRQDSLFGDTFEVVSNQQKADRVWQGIKKKTTYTGSANLYRAFLSELPDVENLIFRYMRYAFASKKFIDNDFGNSDVLEISKIAKMVGREKHRMEAFVRFKLTKDGIYFANIEPDFDVLPVISKHFESRYADQKWLIYDLKRRYGIFYDLQKVETIELTFEPQLNPTKNSTEIFDEKEFEFQKLWKEYFTSTNITERKNLKLHIQHVPRRYWKYLSEKSVD